MAGFKRPSLAGFKRPLTTRITTDLEPIIDDARLIELSSPPKTPMQAWQPEAIDLDKPTRPKAPAKAGE